jgi:hypothetical protein
MNIKDKFKIDKDFGKKIATHGLTKGILTLGIVYILIVVSWKFAPENVKTNILNSELTQKGLALKEKIFKKEKKETLVKIDNSIILKNKKLDESSKLKEREDFIKSHPNMPPDTYLAKEQKQNNMTDQSQPTINHNPINNQAMNQIPMNNQAMNQIPMNNQAMNQVPMNNQAMNQIPMNNQAMNQVPMNNQAMNQVPMNNQAMNQIPMNNQVSNIQAMPTQSQMITYKSFKQKPYHKKRIHKKIHKKPEIPANFRYPLYF